jgi:hypothetical protein
MVRRAVVPGGQRPEADVIPDGRMQEMARPPFPYDSSRDDGGSVGESEADHSGLVTVLFFILH